MARQHPVISDDNLQIPNAALHFEGFREWAQSASFPDMGRIDFLAGEIEVEMSPEDLGTHSPVKTALALGLGNFIAERSLGRLYIDRARLTSPVAQLSVEPDLVVVLWSTLQEGRASFRSWSKAHPERMTEIEGAVDLVAEVVSDSSVGKDTKRLPLLYARAGIPELWIADARGRQLRFQIHTLREGAYEPVAPNAEGWMRSPRLGVDFRLVRRPSPFTGWDYALERRG
jgi:Uma2 family endonuclease